MKIPEKEINAVDAEFRKELEGFKLEFGNLDHIKVVEKTGLIAKKEKVLKKTPKMIKDIMDLKKSVIWLIKLDF